MEAEAYWTMHDSPDLLKWVHPCLAAAPACERIDDSVWILRLTWVTLEYLYLCVCVFVYLCICMWENQVTPCLMQILGYLSHPWVCDDNLLWWSSSWWSKGFNLKKNERTSFKRYFRDLTRLTTLKLSWSSTRPKTTCLSSSQGVLTVVMKNWAPFVFGPELAMERSPGDACLIKKFSSSNWGP